MDKITIVECPRDAMQGIANFIPTDIKVEYLNKLLAVGYPVLDFGSFVSPKAVPQMRDTSQVLAQLDRSKTKSELLAIVANLRGAEEACESSGVDIIGYPMSVSETFQKRNTNKTIVESLEEIMLLVELTTKKQKSLVIYLSMAFGNPYGDPYAIEIVSQFAGVLVSLGIKTISISDTIGLATAKEVGEVFSQVSMISEEISWGLHLHARPENAAEKIKAGMVAGCRRFDGAILGFGGCPMAKDELIGNIDTRTILEVAKELKMPHELDEIAFLEAEQLAKAVFNT